MPKRPLFSINTSWPHFASLTLTAIAILLGLARLTTTDRFDPKHCNALLNRGSWLDTEKKVWQPDGCMLHAYKPSDGAACLKSRHVIFIGDSVTRNLFFQFASILDNTLPLAPPSDGQKHMDFTLHSRAATQLSFYWDPYLNKTKTQTTIQNTDLYGDEFAVRRPALLVLGSGLWYLRYSETSGGLPAWEANTESMFEILEQKSFKAADQVVLLPVEEVIPSKLSPERGKTMRASDIDAMNSDLMHRVSPYSGQELIPFSKRPPSSPVSLPLVFNQMLDQSMTEDGLHFSEVTVKTQANILLNFRCNDVLPKKFPLDKTCCRSYPTPSALHFVVLAGFILWGPLHWLTSGSPQSRFKSLPPVRAEHTTTFIFSGALFLMFIADRTGLWLKEQKQFNPWNFGFLSLFTLGAGLATVRRANKDLGFLNRDQTDEWKGWMQIAILIYHYLGASKISGIYNPIRVLVASYLFMTGYGHTSFYLKKADFSFNRIAQIMIRLNLLTLVLAYTMNTDYISYYFAPLVSMWFLIIYGIMAVGSAYNDRISFVLLKIFITAALTTWAVDEHWVLEFAFEILDSTSAIHWSAREWGFRVGLDLWIVYFGMLAAIATIKAQEYRLTDHPKWPLALKTSIVVSVLTLIWYFAFELCQKSKFTYNLWHPFVSIFPISAFVVLRNATPILRSASSQLFVFIGKCSLETFIIQYHLWLAGDTKGILIVIPGLRWRPANFLLTTAIFIYFSHQVAQATGEITKWICGGEAKGLPSQAPSVTLPSTSRSRGVDAIPMISQNGFGTPKEEEQEEEEQSFLREPDTPIRTLPPRWADRLAEGTRSHREGGFTALYGGSEWRPGVGSKVSIIVVVMWILNISWAK